MESLKVFSSLGFEGVRALEFIAASTCSSKTAAASVKRAKHPIMCNPAEMSSMT